MPQNIKKNLRNELAQWSDGPIRSLFDALSEAQREELLSIARVVEVRRGDCVLAEGAHAHELSYVLDGALAMEKRLVDGRKHIIGMLVPSDMFGRLFDGGSAYDIVALSDCRILNLERDRFEEILTDVDELERLFIVSVLDELDSAREWVILIGANKVIEKLASFLLILLRRTLNTTSSKEAHREPPRVRIPIGRRDLAHYLGTTPETISRKLNELESGGIVLRRETDEIEVRDISALVKISGSDFDISGT